MVLLAVWGQRGGVVLGSVGLLLGVGTLGNPVSLALMLLGGAWLLYLVAFLSEYPETAAAGDGFVLLRRWQPDERIRTEHGAQRGIIVNLGMAVMFLGFAVVFLVLG